MKEIIFWLFLVPATTYACSPAQQSQLRAANDAARLLCESAPAVVREAAFRGVSVEDLCQLPKVIEVFQAHSLAAQDAACEQALPPEAN